ncbi:Na(+)-translocating NADH-quinone reductase subunit B [Arsukibacterium ikkense]|uniref:Na(+)-translocating NADH-quinone reductase subunit B n=1 Tax=Arsukibacterium ikkense TaxID=336831 RepID=A0A0M2V6I1_9GAMM|nr:DUF6482 family protein [Arsukibacterium ikkense]KKO45265.1 Na(+)-translocating NADH-quinone reductase subunit B [Arsukibacterium ikkense]
MNYHRVAHLNRQDVRIDEITIHSFEMGVYLVEALFDSRKGFIVDDKDRPQQFHSVEEVKQALTECMVRQAFLVHQSAYDEMCGGPEKVDNTLRLAVHFSNKGE